MIIHEESQRVTQWWIWAIVLGIAAMIWYGAYTQLVLGRPWGNQPASDTMMAVLALLFGLAFPAFILSVRLRTEVRSDGIRVRLSPFHLRYRRWSWEEIDSIEPREYAPIREYGGWGIRFGPGGWAYNMTGNLGIQLVLVSGKRILIGTRDPDAFMDAVAVAHTSFGIR